MFAPTYHSIKYLNETPFGGQGAELHGKTLNVQFIYRDDDDMPEQYYMFCDHGLIVSNCDSIPLLQAVYFDVTGCKNALHQKHFRIGPNYHYRIIYR